MGHANVENLSAFVIEEIHARGELAFEEAVKIAAARGLTLDASEGFYDDEASLALGLGFVFNWLAAKALIFAPRQDDVWRFTARGAKRYPDVPLLRYIET